MQILNKRIDIASPALLALLMPSLASLAVLGINGDLIPELGKYFLFYVIAVIPTSYCAGRITLKQYNLKFLEALVLGYPVAVVAMAACFIASKSLSQTWIGWILPALAYIYIVKSFKSRPSSANSPPGARRSTYMKIIAIYLISAALLFSTFTLTTYAPSEHFSNNIYEDTLWTIGNTWSLLKNGLPLGDLRFDNIQLGYHIGQNLYYAYTSQLTGINPIDLHLQIAPFYDLFFLVGALIFGAKVFLGTKEKVAWLVAIPVMFCAVEITPFKAGGSPEFHEIYTNPISLAFGLGSFILLAMLLSRRYNFQKRAHEIPYAYVGLIFALTVSCKGILGILIPATIMAIGIAKYIFMGYRIRKCDISLIATMFIIVLLLKLLIFQGASGWLVPPQIEVSPIAVSIAEKIGLGEATKNAYVAIGPASRTIRFLFHTLIWNWLSLPIATVMLAGYLNKSIQLTNTKLLYFGISFAGVCGIIYGLNIIDNYWANLYFYKYTLAIIAVQLGIFLAELVDSYHSRNSIKNKLKILMLLAFGLASTSISFGQFFKSMRSDSWKMDRGLIKTNRPSAFLNREEYDALTWMRNNLPESSVIASDRKDKVGWSGNYVAAVWFNYTAYSGLQFYNEGDAYNQFAISKVAAIRWENIKRLLGSDKKSAALEAWEHINADYIIISKRNFPKNYDNNYLGAVVFSNDRVKVIKNPLSGQDF